jgi:DNA-binding MarR family transcriptional regulator
MNNRADHSVFGLLGLLAHSGRVAEARLDQSLDDARLSVAKWHVLAHLVEAGGALSLGAIAERQSCVKSNVTQLVDRLASEALVVRVPDPLDRRSILAQITDEGRRRYAEGERSLGALDRALRAAFTAGERAQLAELLGRLERAGHDEGSQGPVVES